MVVCVAKDLRVQRFNNLSTTSAYQELILADLVALRAMW
jgi:hypothetical protein